MHRCVVRLLQSPTDEESLECFARIMTTAGKDLDCPQGKVRGREEVGSVEVRRRWKEGRGWGGGGGEEGSGEGRWKRVKGEEGG